MVRVPLLVTAFGIMLGASAAGAADTPKILVDGGNKVPACVKPERLMALVHKRNTHLDERFEEIAADYRRHGEALGIRWDYAFYQMIVETNWLKFKTGSGRWGDVRPKQNNFAGIGATGGGEPGESFTDVSTGVLAHLGHIRLYSGQPLDNPAAKRTRLVADLILPWAQGMGRPVTFTDLTTKWSPTDRGYSDDIETIAKAYRSVYCTGAEEETVPQTTEDVASADTTGETSEKTQYAASAVDETASTTVPSAGTGTASDAAASVPVTAGTQVAALTIPVKPSKPGECKVFTASYGGQKTLLILASGEGRANYTALGVHEGKERAQVEAFIATYAKGGRTIGEFTSPDQALTKAFELCPEG